METKTYRSDSTWFLHHLDPILRNAFSCRSESTEKPILAVTDLRSAPPPSAHFLELYPKLVFRYGIGWYFLGMQLTNTKGKLGKDFDMIHLAGTPFPPQKGCRRPPRYVPYKGTYVPYDGTYGTPDQGQMLDV